MLNPNAEPFNPPTHNQPGQFYLAVRPNSGAPSLTYYYPIDRPSFVQPQILVPQYPPQVYCYQYPMQYYYPPSPPMTPPICWRPETVVPCNRVISPPIYRTNYGQRFYNNRPRIQASQWRNNRNDNRRALKRHRPISFNNATLEEEVQKRNDDVQIEDTVEGEIDIAELDFSEMDPSSEMDPTEISGTED